MKRRIIAGAAILIASAMAVSSMSVAKDYYPERALEDEMNGQATIECVVQADGSLKDCRPLSETPKGYGFGAATVHLFEDEFNINAHPERTEKNMAGDHVTFTYKWTLH